MNKRLEIAIKALDLDPKKTKLIILNSQMFTKDDAHKALAVLKARGHEDATCLMVNGDVRQAAEVYELNEPKQT